jgi:hypothetical protein
MKPPRCFLNGLLVFTAMLSMQSCNPLAAERTSSPQGGGNECAIALRASRSACFEQGKPDYTPPAPVATTLFQTIFVVADTNRKPDSVHVFTRRHVSSSPSLAVKPGELSWSVSVSAVFAEPVQVPETVFVEVFSKSSRLGTVQSLNASEGWSVVGLIRDSAAASPPLLQQLL